MSERNWHAEPRSPRRNLPFSASPRLRVNHWALKFAPALASRHQPPDPFRQRERCRVDAGFVIVGLELRPLVRRARLRDVDASLVVFLHKYFAPQSIVRTAV